MSNDDAVTENFFQDQHYLAENAEFQFHSFLAISVSFLIWASFYQLLLRVLLPLKSKEYCCRILSFLHGTVTAFIGINQCFTVDIPFKHPEWRTTTSQRCVMVLSLGYFMHDLIWLLLYDRTSKLMLAHHTYSAFALYRLLFKDRSGAQATCSLGCMELSNPMLQIRWFLRSEGFYPSVLYTSAEVTFVIIFVLVRIVLGTYFLIIIVLQPRNDWEFRILSVAIYAMTWMFMLNLSKYFLRKYSFKNPENSNKVA